MLHRSKPQRVLASHAEYIPENNQNLAVLDKQIETQIEEAQSQTAASNSELTQTSALPLAREIKPVVSEHLKHKAPSFKQQLTQKIAPRINTQAPQKEALGSAGFFGSVGHAFAVVGLVLLVVGLILFLMGNIISVSIGAFFIGIGLVFLLIWLVLFIIQSVFDVIL
ncbi:MAG: hypothetical protein ACKO5N_00980 [Sphingomonadales bacterium]